MEDGGKLSSVCERVCVCVGSGRGELLMGWIQEEQPCHHTSVSAKDDSSPVTRQ